MSALSITTTGRQSPRSRSDCLLRSPGRSAFARCSKYAHPAMAEAPPATVPSSAASPPAPRTPTGTRQYRVAHEKTIPGSKGRLIRALGKDVPKGPLLVQHLQGAEALLQFVTVELQPTREALQSAYQLFDPTNPQAQVERAQFAEGELDAIEAAFLTQLLALSALGHFTTIGERDLDFSQAFEEDYLLSLPVEVKWSQFDTAMLSNLKASNAAMLRSLDLELGDFSLCLKRGLQERRTRGTFVAQKVDLVQSRALRWVGRPLERVLVRMVSSIRDRVTGVQQLREELRQSGGKRARSAEALLDRAEWLVAGNEWSRSRIGVLKRILADLPEEDAASQGPGGDGGSGAAKEAGPRAARTGEFEAELSREFDAQRVIFPPRMLERITLKDTLTWRLLDEVELVEPSFADIINIFRLAPDPTDPAQDPAEPSSSSPPPQGRRQSRSIHLTRFCEVPFADFKLIFPNLRLRGFRGLDVLRLDLVLVAALGAVALGIYEEWTTNNVVLLLGPLTVQTVRLASSIRNNQVRYEATLQSLLQEKSFGKNTAVLTHLIDAGRDTLYKECLVALHFWRGGAQTLVQVESAAEQFLLDSYGVEIDVDIRFAARLLRKVGVLVEQDLPEESSRAGSEARFEVHRDATRLLVEHSAAAAEQRVRAITAPEDLTSLDWRMGPRIVDRSSLSTAMIDDTALADLLQDLNPTSHEA